MLRAIAILLLLATPARVAASAQQLREEALAQSGMAVRLDERLAVPGCPSGFAFRTLASGGLLASCLETGWQMRLPLASPQVTAPRRGQAVRVEVQGLGYRATVDGIVESANPREGSILLRNPRSGARFVGRLQPDGRVSADIASTR